MNESGDDASEAAVLARMRAARDYSAAVAIPDTLFPGMREHVARGAVGRSRRERHRPFLQALAAVLIGVVGFAAGRVTAGHDVAAASPASQPPGLALQESATQMVKAIDAMAALQRSAPSAAAQNRELVLVALGSALTTGAAEFPDEARRAVFSSMRLGPRDDGPTQVQR